MTERNRIRVRRTGKRSHRLFILAETSVDSRLAYVCFLQKLCKYS